MDRFDRTTWRRLKALVAPFFFGDAKWLARGLLALVIAMTFGIAQVNVLLNYIGGKFTTSLALKEKDEFLQWLVYYLLAFGLATVVTVLKTYTEERTALAWRRWLSHRLLGRYFSGIAYYKLGSYEGIDNPDQRIEEDIRTFTAGTLSLFLILFGAVLTIYNFVLILWSISGNLIVAVLLYALCGSVITYFLGRPLFRLNFDQLRKEADYRYKLVNVRDNAESIAFYGGDRKENTRSRQRLKAALSNFLKIITLNRNLNFFITFYNLLKPVLPIIVIAPLYLEGNITEFGDITRSIDAFVRVVDALSILVSDFGRISSLTAVVSRLGSFFEAIDHVTGSVPPPEPLSDSTSGSPATEPQPDNRLIIQEGNKLAFENVTIYTPRRDQKLIEGLTYEMKPGGLLITGASGSGKSSILRIVAGLWDAGTGNIIRPPRKDCLFLPQRPYMVLGSLRNQLLYVLPRQGVSNAELTLVLEQVGLENMLRRVSGFDRVMDWPNILSTGEQQRLAFARLLLARPRFAFLDEATTALDTASEAKLYLLLERITENYISVGYHTTLSGYHESILQLLGNGQWVVKGS